MKKLLMLVLLASSAVLQAAPMTLGDQLQLLKSDTCLAPDAVQMEQAQTALTRLWQTAGATPKALRMERLQWSPLPADDTWLLHESALNPQGSGALLLNRPGRRAIFLQAPHQYHDLRTGRLVERLQAEGDIMAAFWNTAQRYVAAGCDLVHVESTYLHAFSRAFQQAKPQGLIVQVHGFAADKRTTEAGRTADMIISNGTRLPSPEAKAFAQCLGATGRWQVRLFPHDVNELGATTNTVAADLRQQGDSRFIHWELNAPLRRELADSAARRAEVLTCLQHAAGGQGT